MFDKMEVKRLQSTAPRMGMAELTAIRPCDEQADGPSFICCKMLWSFAFGHIAK
jgi:hypothetical protein